MHLCKSTNRRTNLQETELLAGEKKEKEVRLSYNGKDKQTEESFH